MFLTMQKTKTQLKIDWATHEAAKYACENWHYSKTIPKSKLVKIGAWENGKFIGVLIFSYGATPELVKPYGCTMQEGCELTRIALTKHVSPVSRILSIALKFLKKHCPGLKVIVSFADTNQGHHGGIYQATNWVYTGKSAGCFFYRHKKTGKIYHPRNVSMNLKLSGKTIRPTECEKFWQDGKHRYVLSLNDTIKKMLMEKQKPYPKRASSKDSVAPESHSGESGANPTDALNQN